MAHRARCSAATRLAALFPLPPGSRSQAANFGGTLGAVAGTDDRVNLKGSVHLPLGDTLAVRASLASLQQDGYVERADGVDLGDDDTITGRIALAWHASDALTVDLSLDATRDRENGPAMELLGIDFTDLSQLEGVVLAPPPPMAFIHNITAAAVAQGVPCAVQDPAGNNLLPFPNPNPLSPNCYDNRYVNSDDNQGTAEATSETDVLGLSATVSYQLSDTLTLKVHHRMARPGVRVRKRW